MLFKKVSKLTKFMLKTEKIKSLFFLNQLT